MTPSAEFWKKFWGYYAIPHELLHVLAFRLLGKPCEYQWGDLSVRSAATQTDRERLFILLLPTAVCLGGVLFFNALWLSTAFFIDVPPDRYLSEGPRWPLVFLAVASLLLLYAGNGYADVIRAYRILFAKKKPNKHSPQPHRRTEKQPEQRHQP